MRSQYGTKLSRGDSFAKLAFDQMLYSIVGRLSRRSMQDSRSVGPLCASTTDLITHRLIATGSFERLQLDALDAILGSAARIEGLHIQKDGLFLDVGANLGIFSIRYATFFRRTLAIEANPLTYHVLCANLLLRQCNSVEALCVGASNCDESSFINVDKSGMLGWSSIDKAGILEARETFQAAIQLRPLDDIVSEIYPEIHVSLIKLDIEGHEYFALEGADEIIRTHNPAVLYEKNSSSGVDRCAEFLRKRGYNRFMVFRRKTSFAFPFSRSSIFASEIDPNTSGSAALVLSFIDPSN